MVDNLAKLDAVISDLEAQASSHNEFVGVLAEIGRLAETLEKLSAKYIHTSEFHESTSRKLDQTIDETKTTALAAQASLTTATTRLGSAVVTMQKELSSHQEKVTDRAIADIKSYTDIARDVVSKTLENNIAQNHAQLIKVQKESYEAIQEHQQQLEQNIDDKLHATNNRVLVVVTVALLTAIVGVLAMTH